MATQPTYAALVQKMIRMQPPYNRDAPVPRLSFGNEKLAKTSTAVWDLPAIITCPGATLCAAEEFCYATQFRYRMNSKMQILVVNYLAAKKALRDDSFRVTFKGLIAAQVARSQATSLRIHSAGDFFSQAYVDLWCETLKYLTLNARPVLAYCYTKSLHLDLGALRDLCNVVQSVGGKFDHLIDYTLPHAAIFSNKAELLAAGYEDGSETDEHAMRGTIKVGLIVRPNTKGRYRQA